MRKTFCPGLFAVKLREMEKAYVRLQCRIELCQSTDQDRLLKEIDILKDECLENDILLRKTAQGSRTPEVAELAGVQLTYDQHAQQCLEKTLSQSAASDEQAEAATVYAEFAIDQAIQSMNHALLAALIAVEKQLTVMEENTKEVPK